MSITATSFATRIRTWLLIAALTALLIAVGGALGGGFLYLFVGLAVLMNVIGYWFSDKLALKASRARPLEAGEIPELEMIARDLAKRADVPVPRLYLIPSDQPNAFATGRNPSHAAVAVTGGLLTQLPMEEVRGVLAHEFAHIKNRDILVTTVAAMVAGAISAIASILQFSLLFGGADDEDSPLGLLGTLATIIVAPIAAMLLQLGVAPARVPRGRNGREAAGSRCAAGGRPRDARARLSGTADECEPGDCLTLRRQPAAAAGPGLAVHDPPADR